MACFALQMDGAEYSQSTALLRYAGKLGGLYPECPLAALKVCVYFFGVDCREGSRFPLVVSLFCPSTRCCWYWVFA